MTHLYQFYDNWVARTLNGNTFRSRLDIFAETRNGFRELFYSDDDAGVRQRFADARPIPVYSCWNGMIAMDPRPFIAIRQDGKFRKGKAPVRFRPAKRNENECGEFVVTASSSGQNSALLTDVL